MAASQELASKRRPERVGRVRLQWPVATQALAVIERTRPLDAAVQLAARAPRQVVAAPPVLVAFRLLWALVEHPPESVAWAERRARRAPPAPPE
jgi:hypothetical protein